MSDQGFKKLKGKTIKDVRVDGINCVRLLCDDGTVFVLDSDELFLGIAVLNLSKLEEKLETFSRKKKFVAPVEAGGPPIWPYPADSAAKPTPKEK